VHKCCSRSLASLLNFLYLFGMISITATSRVLSGKQGAKPRAMLLGAWRFDIWPAKVLRQFELVPQTPRNWTFMGLITNYSTSTFLPTLISPYFLSTTSQDPRNRSFMWSSSRYSLRTSLSLCWDWKHPLPLNLFRLVLRQMTRSGQGLGISQIAVPWPLFTALSAIGTKLCFYTIDKATMEMIPEQIARHMTRVDDIAPANRWHCDILETKRARPGWKLFSKELSRDVGR